VVLALAATLGWAGGLVQAAEKDEAYALTVENASAKVGEAATIVARIDTKDGFKFSKAYRNRVIELSAEDDSVTFEREVVTGRLENGHLLFEVPVVPTRAGAHPINGLFRIGFHKNGRLNMISVPLMATVTGIE
jgi:hypothetical protein